MVKKSLLFFLPLVLYAASMQNVVQELLPREIYRKNSSVIDTLFVDRSRYVKEDGTYNYGAIFTALEKVGILHEALGEKDRVELSFVAKKRPYLMFFLSERALEYGNVYDYRTFSMAFSPQAYRHSYTIKTTGTISFAKIVEFLERNGVTVRRVRYDEEAWSFDLGMEGAYVATPKVTGSAEFKDIKNSLWLDVCGAKRVKIQSFGNYWHPSVAIYDADLVALDLYKEYEVERYIELTLPNRACYIKISDIFTPKNIRRGFSVTLETRGMDNVR